MIRNDGISVLQFDDERIAAALSDPAGWSLQEARRIALEVCEGRDVRIILFGSRARGDYRFNSDIDIAVDGKGAPLPPKLCGDLLEQYDLSLIPYKVDVVDLADTSEDFRQEVEREGIVWID